METEQLKVPDYRFPRIDFNADGSASFTCDTIGVAGTTPIFVRRIPTGRADWPWKYEVRMGIAIMGGMNDPESPNKNPFNEDWRDNFVKGVHCHSVEKAVEKMMEDLKGIQDSLWAE